MVTTGRFEVLKQRDFRVMLATRLLVMMGWTMQDVIIGWQVYGLTHSAFVLGLTGLAEAVPALVCALFAGHIVDISRPYRVLLICLSVMTANAFVLLLTGGGFAHPPGGVVAWLFFGIFISGLARAFVMPASFALLPQIVARVHMPAASAFLTTGFQLATVIAPAAVGLVYASGGAHTAWFLPLLFMGAAWMLLLFGVSPVPRAWRNAHTREAVFASMRNGWRFIWSNKTLLSVMALDMFAVLFGGAVAMLPAVAAQILHVGATELGILRAAPAAGALISALTLALYPLQRIKARWLLVAVAGFGLCTIGFGFSTYFWLSVFLLALSGVFDSISMVIRSTLMQWLTPDDMRGRVSSVNSMFIISSNEIGAFESGVTADWLGLALSIVFGGVGTLVVVVLTTVLVPRLRGLEVKAEN